MQVYQRAKQFTPWLVTAGVLPTPLATSLPRRDAFWVAIAVRDMGTSAWVAIGDSVQVLERMYYVNDFWVKDVPAGCILDIGDFFCASEIGDAELEISAMGPVSMVNMNSIPG